MNSLDYVEAVARQHEIERERDWAARFREQHPEQDAGRDNRWADFIHRFAGHTSAPGETAEESSGGYGIDDRFVTDRKIDR